jgi:quercetin dioxygenase-like cupin family protein
MNMHSGRTPFLWGMLAGASLMSVVLAGTSARASAQPAPAKSGVTEPVRKVLLDNARVHVRDVVFAPGASPMHTHDLPHVGIILTAGTLVFTEPGKPADSVKFDAGSVGFREAGVTHQVTNPGSSPMHVIEVELK